MLPGELLLLAGLKFASYECPRSIPADLNKIACFDTRCIGSAVDIEGNTGSLFFELSDTKAVGFHDANLDSPDEYLGAAVRRGVEDSYFEYLIDEFTEKEFGVGGFEVDGSRRS